MQSVSEAAPDDSGVCKCCKCCTPNVTLLVLSILGVVIFIISFVVSAVVLSALQDGLNNTARYNSPRTDNKAFNDWLTNVPSKRSDGDASLKYYSFYFFNITNLDAVVTASLSPASAKVLPIVEEIGPYTYRKYVDKFDVDFENNDDKVSWQEYSRYVFEPSYSKMGNRQLSDTTDLFIQPSAFYTGLFANPHSSPFYQQPEYNFRLAVGSAAPFIYTSLLNTMFGGTLLNSSVTGAAAIQILSRTVYSNQYQAINQTKARDAFKNAGATLYPSSPTKWAGAPALEYWDFLNTAGGFSSQYYLQDSQALALVSSTFTNTQLPPIGGFDCTDMRLTNAGAAACWIYHDESAIFQYITLFSAPEQLTGLKSWLLHLTHEKLNWAFSVMGHQAARYVPQFTGSCQPDPEVSTNFTDCYIFNNANLYVQATPWSLLWEDMHLIAPLLYAGTSNPRPTKLSYFTNHTSESDARKERDVSQVGTGINDISDLDNIYKFKNTSAIPVGASSSVWCHVSSDPKYAPNGTYYVQNFQSLGFTFNQASQAQSTKMSPNYPPGRINDKNHFELKNSVIGDRSFNPDLWIYDLSRHAKLQWAKDLSYQGIDLYRYTIADEEYDVIPFFGQNHRALANYTCTGTMTFSSLPRYNKLNLTEIAETTMDITTIVAPSNQAFDANGPFGPNFFAADDLYPYIDLEPISGAALAGSLKMQINLQIDHWIGAPKFALDTLVAREEIARFQQTAPKFRPTLIPTLWLNKMGFLSSKQASSFKSSVYGAKIASKVVLIVGSIVGGLMTAVFSYMLVARLKKRPGFAPQASQEDLRNGVPL